MLLPTFAHFFFEQIGNDQILAHGFSRCTTLGDDVEAGLFDIDDIKKRCHAFRVDVIFDIQLRTIAFFSWQFIVVQMIECLLNSDRTQCATADTEHNEGIKLRTNAIGDLVDFFDDFSLIVGQFCPAKPASAPIFLNLILCHFGGCLHGGYFVSIDAVLKSYHIAHHVINIQNNRSAIDRRHYDSSFQTFHVLHRLKMHSLRHLV